MVALGDPEVPKERVELLEVQLDVVELRTPVGEVRRAPAPELVVVDDRAAGRRQVRERGDVVVRRPGTAVQDDERRRPLADRAGHAVPGHAVAERDGALRGGCGNHRATLPTACRVLLRACPGARGRRGP